MLTLPFSYIPPLPLLFRLKLDSKDFRSRIFLYSFEYLLTYLIMDDFMTFLLDAFLNLFFQDWASPEENVDSS